MARHAALTHTTISPRYFARAYSGGKRGTNKHNNGLAGMLPETKRKPPRRPGKYPPGRQPIRFITRPLVQSNSWGPNKMRTGLTHQEAVIPPT